MRSMLTMLGLMIGVAAVILLTSFGQGVSNSVNAAIEPVAWRRSRWPGSAVLSGW
jgi:putative ABC transport system permease protein